MKKLLCSTIVGLGLLAGSAYADLTLAVAPNVQAPVTFNIGLSATGIAATSIPSVTVSPGSSSTIAFSDYRSELMQFRGAPKVTVTVSANKKFASFSGKPGSGLSKTLTYPKNFR